MTENTTQEVSEIVTVQDRLATITRNLIEEKFELRKAMLEILYISGGEESITAARKIAHEALYPTKP